MSIELKSIRICYGDTCVFDDFSLSLPDRGIYALIGKSGSGKTTLLRTIAGLQPIDGGEVTLPERTSFSFQEYRLLPNLSVLDNLVLVSFQRPDAAAKERARAILHRFSLSGYEDAFPSALSGGMRQRVSLARAFLCDAPVLLLDEPLKELDANLRDEVCHIIREEGARRLVVLSLHDEEIASLLGAQIIPIA